MNKMRKETVKTVINRYISSKYILINNGGVYILIYNNNITIIMFIFVLYYNIFAQTDNYNQNFFTFVHLNHFDR